MRISIIIPTHNDLPTLRQTVDSCLMQDHPDFEVIVANDAGDDPSGVLPLEDPRLTFVDMPVNGGVGAARNAGLEHATGEVLLFLDADDTLRHGLLRYIDDIFGRMENVDIMSLGHVNFVDADGTAEMPVLPAFDAPTDPVAIPLERFCHLFLHETKRFIPSAAPMRASTIRRIAGDAPWPTGLTNALDTQFTMTMARELDFYSSEDEWVQYRSRPNSMSHHNFAQTFRARMQAVGRIADMPVETPRHKRIQALAHTMRHGAARRVARIVASQGKHSEAVSWLWADLKRPGGINAKSVVSLLRHIVRL